MKLLFWQGFHSCSRVIIIRCCIAITPDYFPERTTWSGKLVFSSSLCLSATAFSRFVVLLWQPARKLKQGQQPHERARRDWNKGNNPTREPDEIETRATTPTESQTRLKQGQQPQQRTRRHWNRGNNPTRESDETETRATTHQRTRRDWNKGKPPTREPDETEKWAATPLEN